jgi:hypothetical protein
MQAALDGLKSIPASLNPVQRALYELNANGVKVHTETLEAALAQAIVDQRKKEGGQTSVLGKGFGPAVAAALTKTLPILKIPALKTGLAHDIARLASLQGKLHHAKESGDKGRAAALKGRVDNLGRRIDSEKRALAAVQQQVKNATTTGLNNLGGIERTGNGTIERAVQGIGERIVAAIYANPTIVNPTTIVRSTVRNGRAGPPGGSSNTQRTRANGFGAGP